MLIFEPTAQALQYDKELAYSSLFRLPQAALAIVREMKVLSKEPQEKTLSSQYAPVLRFSWHHKKGKRGSCNVVFPN